MTVQIPQQLLAGVVQVFDPLEVYLFGSHARNEAHQDSDIDLFVVVDDDKKGRFRRGEATYAARNGYRGPLDIFVTTQSHHRERRGIVGTLDEIVAGESRLIYARA